MKIKRFGDEVEIDVIDKGDWVLCDCAYRPEISDFISNNAGKLLSKVKDPDINRHIRYFVKYWNIPLEFEDYFASWGITNNKWEGVREFSRENIIFHSKDKEDIEALIAMKKYNL